MVAPSASLQETRVYGDGALTGDKLMVAPQLASASTPGTFRFDSGDNVTGFDIASVAASSHYGGRLVFDSSVDMTSDKWLMFRGYYEEFNLFPVLDTVANGGLCVLLYDASNNYVQYNYHGQGWDNREGLLGGWQTNAFDARGADIFIDLDFPADASFGTVNMAAITGIELHSRFTASRTTVPIFLGRITLAGAWLITNGETANKATFSTLYTEIQTQANTWSYFKGMVNLNYDFDGQIGQAYSCRKDIHIGDGATTTEFRDTGFSLSFYPTRDNDAGDLGDTNDGSMPHVLANPSSREFIVNQSASDIVEFVSGRWAGWDTVGGDWHWECQGNTSGTCTVLSNSFFRASYVRIGHSNHVNSSYDDVENVEVTPDSTLTNCSIRNCAGKGLYLIGGAGDYSACDVDFEDSFTGDEITVADAVAGSYTVTGITAGHTINIHNESAASAITVTIPQGVSYTTSTAGGTVTIAQPSNTFTINVSEPLSLIQVFTTGTQTLLDSTTGSSLAFTHTGQTVDYVVQKAGYLPQRFTGTALSGNSSVTVSQVADPVYFSGHGLTYTTDFSYNRATSKLTLGTQSNADAVYSALIDAFIAQTSLYNTPFKFQANGPTSFIFNDDAEFIDTTSLNNWKRGGVQYVSSSDVVTAEWAAIFTLSTGIPAGAQAEYQQTVGSGTTDAINTGAIDELIQVYGDATHGNFTKNTHLVVKYQENGYQQVRVDVVSLYSLSTIQAVAYPIATPFLAINAATGDPAITITVVDHSAAPITVGGKQFSYEIQDGAANSGESILREINYNNSLDATYQGKDPFNWPDMVGELGSAYDSVRGWVEDESAQLGFYVSRGGNDHPDFSRFQSDDGTYYTPAVQATAQISNIVAGSRLRIYNQTTATETVNAINAGTSYSQSYTDGTTYSAGDVIDIYITYQSGVTAKLEFQAVAVATSEGWSAIVTQVDDEVYNLNAIDGSLITKFTADYVDDEIDINSVSNFTATEFYAWWCYNVTTEEGIREFFGGFTAIDAANYRNNNSIVSVFWDNLTTTNLRQTDNPRIYRADEAYPVKNNGATTGGGGIDINWQDKVFLATTGSGPLTPAQEAQLSNAASDSATAVSQNTAMQGTGFDTGTDSLVQIRDNLGGGGGDATEANQLTILSNQAAIDAKLDTKASQADLTSVKGKTDQLTFTVPNQIDANTQYVNDVEVSGSGVEGDEWGPSA